jgi:hypothetical protein
VVPKPMAGHANLAAAGLEQHRLIEVGQVSIPPCERALGG